MSLRWTPREGTFGAMTRAMAYGVLGGVTGILAMDLVMVVELWFARMPLTTYLRLIGSVFGGGVALGIFVHLVVGALPGLGLGVLTAKVKPLRIGTAREGLRLGFIVGVLSIPSAACPSQCSPACRCPSCSPFPPSRTWSGARCSAWFSAIKGLSLMEAPLMVRVRGRAQASE